MRQVDDSELKYEYRPIGVHEKLMAGFAAFAWVWVVIDLVITQSNLGFSEMAIREWVWVAVMTFSVCGLTVPVLKRRIINKAAQKRMSK